MREILFRGKRIDNKEWVYGDLIHYKNNDYRILEQGNGDWDILEAGYKIDPATVGQFTGLLDKNGKRIFEGDKIRIRETEVDEWEVYSVKYYEEMDYPAFDTSPQIDCDSNGLSHAMATCEVEIIGNIHDD